MKITIHDEPGALKLQLEGSVVGPWVGEFGRTWHELEPSLKAKKLTVDLCGVLHMDVEGRQLLAEIYRKTHAALLANTPMAEFFAEETRRRSANS